MQFNFVLFYCLVCYFGWASNVSARNPQPDNSSPLQNILRKTNLPFPLGNNLVLLPLHTFIYPRAVPVDCCILIIISIPFTSCNINNCCVINKTNDGVVTTCDETTRSSASYTSVVRLRAELSWRRLRVEGAVGLVRDECSTWQRRRWWRGTAGCST